MNEAHRRRALKKYRAANKNKQTSSVMPENTSRLRERESELTDSLTETKKFLVLCPNKKNEAARVHMIDETHCKCHLKSHLNPFTVHYATVLCTTTLCVLFFILPKSFRCCCCCRRRAYVCESLKFRTRPSTSFVDDIGRSSALIVYA